MTMPSVSHAKKFLSTWEGIGCVILVIAFCKIAFDFAVLLSYYAARPTANDFMVYFGVGRGILNGLTPYADLFEMKPPGIFLVSALSLFLSGDEIFAWGIYMIILFTIPILVTAFAIAHTRGRSLRERALLILAAIDVAMILTIAMAHRVYSFQTEAYGLFFAFLFVSTILWQEPFSLQRITLATIGLIGSIGFKEPFFLTTLAVAILFLKNDWEAWLRGWIVPIVLTTLIAVGIMFALGWLQPYVWIYLPFVFGSRLHADTQGIDAAHSSLFVRGFWMKRAFTDLLGPPYPIFGLIIVGLIAFYLLRSSARASTRTMIWTTAKMIAALYLSTLAIAMGNFYSSHAVFAFPVYLALFLFFLRNERETVTACTPGMQRAILVFLLSATAFVYSPAPPFFSGLENGVQMTRAAFAKPVDAFDALMEACNIKTYMVVGRGWPLVPYGKVSPVGPIFDWLEFLTEDHPLVTETYDRGFPTVPLIITRADTVSELNRMHERLDVNGFSRTAPACAEGLFPIKGFILLFRRSAFPSTPAWEAEKANPVPLFFADPRFNDTPDE